MASSTKVKNNKEKNNDDMRLIMLSGDVSEDTISCAIKQLFELDFKKVAPIHVLIDSYGGEAHEMFALYDAFKACKSDIATMSFGKVMSAGVLLLAAGKKGTRKIGRHTRLMIHPMHGIAFGNMFEQENDLNEMKKLQTMMNEAYVKETNLTEEQVKDLMNKSKELYYDADEAIKMGFADEIVG